MFKDLMLFLTTVIVLYSAGMYTVLAAETSDNYQTDRKEIDMFVSYSYTESDEGVSARADIMLTTGNIPLNAFEAEVFTEDSNVRITDVVTHTGLCEPRFQIEKAIDNSKGYSYVVCGSATPFITGTGALPVVTVFLESPAGTKPTIRLGKHTSFYIHDGLGTQASVKLMGDTVEV